MKMKISTENIYMSLLSVVLWEKLFFGVLRWSDSVTPVVIQISRFAKLLIVLLFIAYMMFKLTKRSSLYDIVTIIVLACLYISYNVVNENTLLYSALVVMLAKDFEIKRILEVYFKNIIVIIICVVLVFIFGLTIDNEIVFSYATGHSLGTGHPNVLGGLLLNVTLLAVLLFLRDKPRITVLTSFAMAAVVYFLTASRTSTVLLMAFGVIYILFLAMKKTRSQWMMKALKFAVFAVVAFSLYMMLAGGQVFGLNDNNFYVRFIQANNIYQSYGIHLWGSDVTFVSMSETKLTGAKAVILDNGYLRLLLCYGLISFCLFIIGIAVEIRKVSKRKEYMLLLMSAVFLVGGLMEKSVYSIQLNFTLLFITARNSEWSNTF